MKLFIAVIVFFQLLFAACRQKQRGGEKKSPPAITKYQTITIAPLGRMETALLKRIASGIRGKLSVIISIRPPEPIPAFAFYKPRQRYIADSLLVFLRKLNKDDAGKIIGITSKDISTRKDPHENWGILGLGSLRGEACVISTYRAGKGKVTDKDFTHRMITLALHELGHTYGLDHCPENTCLMKDAQGKMNLDDGDSYCEKCKISLAATGVLK
jgi:archaemetzincin